MRSSKRPGVAGEVTDLSRYPARAGFEDLVTVVSSRKNKIAWTAVAFPDQGYVWYSLKKPEQLGQTVLWMSNRGRHYSPWNGRHSGVLGLEEVTAYFHKGLAESIAPNPISALGSPTFHQMNPKVPMVIRLIQGVCAIPKGFDHVNDIQLQMETVILKSRSGKAVRTALDTTFLD